MGIVVFLAFWRRDPQEHGMATRDLTEEEEDLPETLNSEGDGDHKIHGLLYRTQPITLGLRV